MAKIGYLYLRRGEWEDKTLVPPAWVDRVSHATVDMNTRFEPALRYSNFFWALPNKNVYMAVGYKNQVIMVFPALDIVAVTTTSSFYPLALDGRLHFRSGQVRDGVSSGAGRRKRLLPPSATSQRKSRPRWAQRPRPRRRSREKPTRFRATDCV